MTNSQRLAWLLLVLALGPATARAGDKEEAKAHVTRATRAHKTGHYDEARRELEAAYALDPDPSVLYALGQVSAKLGQCSDATIYFMRFAATQDDPQVAKVVAQAIAACKPAAPATAAPTSPEATAAAEATAPVAAPSTAAAGVAAAPTQPFAAGRAAARPASARAPAPVAPA